MLGIRMQRNEAISYLKQLLGKDIGISPDSISLDKKEDRRIVEIHIKVKERESIKELAKIRGLDFKEENESIIIYG
jgi:hypothetical protein